MNMYKSALRVMLSLGLAGIVGLCPLTSADRRPTAPETSALSAVGSKSGSMPIWASGEAKQTV
ncbi:hypothetical protein [Kitasatospora sp. NPDC088351]|uniref:hypothetical protein n=1 Tax=unclassified Kitasatospora TaxID=2633591 RepID=UPI0034227EBB